MAISQEARSLLRTSALIGGYFKTRHLAAIDLKFGLPQIAARKSSKHAGWNARLVSMTPSFISIWNTYVKDSMPIFAAIVSGMGGAIVGGFLVHVLTQSREREKWILDSKKGEYRELLSALSLAHESTCRQNPGFLSNNGTSFPSIVETQRNSIRIFSDRIFITKDFELDAHKKAWREAMGHYSYGVTSNGIPYSATNFTDEYDRIKTAIVESAYSQVPKTIWQRLKFWQS